MIYIVTHNCSLFLTWYLKIIYFGNNNNKMFGDVWLDNEIQNRTFEGLEVIAK